VAGVEAEPEARAQLLAIARVRWLVFIHSLRTAQGVLELFSRIVVSCVVVLGGLGGAVGFGASARFFVSTGQVGWLALLLWPVFVFWQFFPVMATALTETLDTSNLLRFPLNYRSYVLVRLAYGAMDPSTILGGLWLAGISIGIGMANPRLLPWAVAVLGAFGLLNILLAQMVFAWVDRWLAQRRTREVFAVLFILLILGVQLIGPLVSRYSEKPGPLLTGFGKEVTPVQRALPPGIAAAALAAVTRGHVLEGVAFLAMLGAYGVLILRALNARLRAQYWGENLSEVPSTAVRGGEVALQLGWHVPGLSGPVTAVLEKEFRYLARSGPMLLTLITPVFMLVIFGLGSGRTEHEGFLQHRPGLGFPAGAAYSLLLLTNVVYNSFGADGGGIQFFLASPVPFRTIVIAKNLALVGVLALEVAGIWITVSLIFHRPSLEVTLATLAGLLFAAPINLAAGNLLSLYSPKRTEFAALGRQRASQLTVLLSFAVQIAVFGVGAVTILLAQHFSRISLATLIFCGFALVALALYGFVLSKVDGLAMKRREALTTELCR